MEYSHEFFTDIEKRYPKVAAGFDRLARDIAEAGPLDRRTQLLIKIGVSVGTGSQGNIQKLTQEALAEGVSGEEIMHAVLLSTTNAGFPSMIVAMQWVRDVVSARLKLG
jgi:4-carboxymuconolactone decarboxylase